MVDHFFRNVIVEKLFVRIPILHLRARKQDIGAPEEPEVVTTASYLPTGASMGLAGQHRPKLSASADRQYPWSIWWGCALSLCILPIPRDLQLSVGASNGGRCRVHVIGLFTLFFGQIGWWQGVGPRLKPAFLSTAPLCPIVCCTYAPLFCTGFGLEWGLRQGRGSLVLPWGKFFTLDFNSCFLKTSKSSIITLVDF